MKVLIVFSHPSPRGLCRSLLDETLAACREAGHEMRLIDLYASAFDPRLTETERRSYYEAAYVSEAREQLDALVWAEALVLIFPTWWFGFPAMLKGWIDRTFAPGAAFDHTEDFGPIRPRLVNLRHALAVTTLGSPWWVDRLVMRRPLRRILKTAILGTCAPHCRLTFLSLYNAEKASRDGFAAFSRKIGQTLRRW